MKTPTGNRLHIGIYGRRNAGKSTLINALTGQQIAIVSDTPGTTADPVYKSMEMRPIGPVVFIDTAGYDDEGELGKLRVKKTEATLAKADIAILVVYGQTGNALTNAIDLEWQKKLEAKGIPYVIYDSQWLEGSRREESINKLREELATLAGATETAGVTAQTHDSPDAETMAATGTSTTHGNEDAIRRETIERLVKPGDLVLLVMPQDISAPKGRLILPQVQTLRELLDRGCTAVTTTADGFADALKSLSRDPDLIITDSQCFSEVYNAKPEGTALTSFSVLFAAYKGNIETFKKGAEALDIMATKIGEGAPLKILIAEACTHVPAGEDIGTVKIPRGIRKYIEKYVSEQIDANIGNLEIVNVNGNDFPCEDELKEYDLVIHCGACMFNRKHVLSRIAQCESAGVPISNYGIVLAKLSGILDKIMV